MMHTLEFANDAPAQTQLLAVSLKLMALLRAHHRLFLYVPKHVHIQLSQADFGRVLYDLLSAEYPDLQNRLEIRVHNKTEFLVLTQPPGAHHEIS
jgi:hypothetical protein